MASFSAGFDERASLVEHIGYIWLFVVSGLFMLRLLLDATMVRRPLLEPNLTAGGLMFLGLSLFGFVVTNITVGSPDRASLSASQRAAGPRDGAADEEESKSLLAHGPGFPLLYSLPYISTQSLLEKERSGPPPVADAATRPADERPPEPPGDSPNSIDPAPVGEQPQAIGLMNVVTARVVAIVSQLAIIIGMVLIGMRHFDNVKTGVAAATLYLLLPYTAMWAGNSTHVLPGALLVWAVVMYRRPLVSGSLVGLACGAICFPLFLLPLWSSFYWRRGLWRFLIGTLVMLGLMIALLALASADVAEFWERLRQMFNVRLPLAPIPGAINGAWKFWNPVYRVPILVGFAALSLSLALWPAQKNLGTLLAYSAAVMLGTQFWDAHTGGLAMAWYLPLLVLTIFRPNLEDRLAQAVVK